MRRFLKVPNIVRNIQSRKMHINYIPMRWGTGDNYCYLLSDDNTKKTWIIDPAEPDEVLPKLKNFDIDITAIVNTHHHYDHSGGNTDLVAKFSGIPLIAGKDSPLVSYTPAHNEVIQLGDSVEITALHTPCHTQDSICYYAEDKVSGERAVFTGDTLFTSGCGRFFEGTPKEMDYALNKILGALPADTKVYPGHEYTKSNVKFSNTVLQNPDLSKLTEKANSTEVLTGMYTIGDEKKFNPFMRLQDPQVIKATNSSTEVEAMARLRELKNKL